MEDLHIFSVPLDTIVKVDRIYSYIHCANQKCLKKGLNYLPIWQSVEQVCPQKNERQQRKPVIDASRNKKEIKNKKFRIPITPISAAEEKGVSIIFLKNISGA